MKEPSKKVNTNKLIKEKSPYLLQHVKNPVDWYPWGEEAFERAKKENKPIFLSIGYSTCHWCHVMAHESFEDNDVAELMNEVFVSIKVDREERPDIDNMYMTFCQIMTGSGGWPLTIIMTPDKKPFFAGTYFPKESSFGRMGMLELIPTIKELWINQRDELLKSADQIIASAQNISSDAPGGELDESALRGAYEEFVLRFDDIHGGFGDAPKFPSPHNLLFLLRFWLRLKNEKALKMVEKSLQGMQRGGIYDHIGFGFHRYSTDSRWLVPHFEKMLYDQALLAMAYTEAFQATGNKEYVKTAREVLTYVLRDMTSSSGGFYSAEDADSEGVEGKFYLWTEKEIKDVLDEEEGELIIKVFNVTKNGNYFEETTRKKTGKNILHLNNSIEKLASDLKIPEKELRMKIEKVRMKLFEVREKRVHPHKDDKILTDLNGLMIAAFAKAAQVSDEPKYTEEAKKALDFILNKMRKSDGRLLHRYRDGQADISGYVDDYAFLIWGLIELYETTFEVHYLKTALELNDILLKHFWDDKRGGFYFTADDAEELLIRKKEIYDGAIPSGNSVAMLNLIRLGRITANSDLEGKARIVGSVFSDNVKRSPSAFTQLMMALDYGVGPSYEVVIVGNSKAKDTNEMLKALRKQFIPNKVVILRATEMDTSKLQELAEFTKYQNVIDGKATAYVCQNFTCKAPTTDIDYMLELLDVKK